MISSARRKKLSRLGMSLFVGTFFCASSFVSGSPRFIPVTSGHFTAGQWFFQGQNSSLGGNVGLTFVPALRFSNRFSLIPMIESSYRATRSGEELAGGNTLFQDTWENGIAIKAVHGLSKRWKLREKTGFRTKWFRETTNETWTKGLYDYQIYNVGTEIEYKHNSKLLTALGYDFSVLQFPNYVSLESTQSSDLAREFSGNDVLDERIHLFSLRNIMPFFWGVKTMVQTFYSPRNYTDQQVVNVTGLLTATKRKDDYFGTTLSLERGFNTFKKSRLITNVSYAYTGLDSNQNHYDARLTQFIADFYDYDQQSVGLTMTLAFGRNRLGPLLVDTSYKISRRNYRSRVTQTVDGAYNTDKLYVRETALTVGFSYPLTRNIRLKTNSTFGRSTSNNDYEQVYRYNYSNANYQFGFSYEY